jgi:hypothetical protein
MKKVLSALALSVFSLCVSAASLESKYLQLGSDVQVSGTQALIQTSVTLAAPAWVYIQADGRYYPGPPSSRALANAYILVNGSLVSNDSIIDWRQSDARGQHSFNAVSAVYLGAGTHSVGLYGASVNSSVYFGATSGLAIMVDAADHATNTPLAADTNVLSFNTAGVDEGMPLPDYTGRSTVLSTAAGNSGPVVALLSGRSYVYGAYGDAMWGIFLNNAEPNIDSMTWSINDLYTGAETQAPMYSQALFLNAPTNSSVQLVASESPYYQPRDPTTNQVKYKVGAGSRLVTLSGGMEVYGKALDPAFSYGSAGEARRFAYKCVGTTNGYLPSCPPSGAEVVVGEGQVCIPPGHNGVAMFTAKTRVQADTNDIGGSAYLFIRIDGQQVGSLGIQQLGPKPNTVSTRTLTAGYLAAGPNALSPGCHTVKAG